MQSAEAVLGILRERGRRGLPLEELYRQMFNPALYLLAWGRVYSNTGAMTPGVTAETASGMSVAKIKKIIGDMRAERYRFAPVRRVTIPKKSGGRRPLGMPTWSDKLVGEVMRLLLEAYYEPRFSDQSHGFRPGRGCHTALTEIDHTWKGTTWFIEADVRDCFGSLDHEVMLGILAEDIHDGRFLELVRRMLKSGYLEDWKYGATYSGAPQGGVLSPLLSNVYLNRLDRWVADTLIPQHTKGARRARNNEHARLSRAISAAWRRGDRDEHRRLSRLRRRVSSVQPMDPGYRRLRYSRYADDHLLGFTGPKSEAEGIKAQLAGFLSRELRLELSGPKTLITHARSGRARYLGYDITVNAGASGPALRDRALSGHISLRVPPEVVRANKARYMSKGKPAATSYMVSDDDYTIVGAYGARYRGIVEYYKLAVNMRDLRGLRWVMETSMLKTLAAKHRTTVTKTAAKHKAVVLTPRGPRRCFEAVLDRGAKEPLIARFGETPLWRDRAGKVGDIKPGNVVYRFRQVVPRLLARVCELCGSRDEDLIAYQVKNLAAIDRVSRREHPAHAWMRGHRRKTLMVCASCYAGVPGPLRLLA